MKLLFQLRKPGGDAALEVLQLVHFRNEFVGSIATAHRRCAVTVVLATDVAAAAAAAAAAGAEGKGATGAGPPPATAAGSR